MGRAFILDGSDDVRTRLIQLVAAIDGVQVVGDARSVPAVLETIERTAPDLLIVDVSMHEAAGLRILERLGDQSGLPDTVIALTWLPHPYYRRRCLELGAHFMLDKPAELDTLETVLQGLSGCAEDVLPG